MVNIAITECLYHLGKAYSKTRYGIRAIRPRKNFYKVIEDGKLIEYEKEVAEIIYKNGEVRYADIGCDSESAAIYDVVRVIEGKKKESTKIERLMY